LLILSLKRKIRVIDSFINIPYLVIAVFHLLKKTPEGAFLDSQQMLNVDANIQLSAFPLGANVSENHTITANPPR
jgi:hypothetical protein